MQTNHWQIGEIKLIARQQNATFDARREYGMASPWGVGSCGHHLPQGSEDTALCCYQVLT